MNILECNNAFRSPTEEARRARLLALVEQADHLSPFARLCLAGAVCAAPEGDPTSSGYPLDRRAIEHVVELLACGEVRAIPTNLLRLAHLRDQDVEGAPSVLVDRIVDGAAIKCVVRDMDDPDLAVLTAAVAVATGDLDAA